MSEGAEASIELAEEGSRDYIDFAHRHALATLTLARPEALNALNTAMRRRIAAILPRLPRNVINYILIWKSSSPRAFSAGGDLRELIALSQSDRELAYRSFREEYELNWLVECFPKPSIAMINGMAIGGGAGLVMYLTHRIAGENYSFSMPETSIGFFPDDGLAHVFARMPAEIGMYLGLTGRPVGRADALYLDLVTHSIDAQHYAAIETELADAEPVDPVLANYEQTHEPAGITQYADIIAKAFEAPSVEEIIERLAKEPRERDWCEAVIADLRSHSPLALKVTHRHIRAAAAMDIRQTLEVDYRLACRLLDRPDFTEGIRARLIDRDNKPRWQHASLSDVTDAMVDDCFAPMPGSDLNLLIRHEMQKAM